MSKILEIKNLHKTFKNRVKAVQGISLDVDKGDVFGFLGPNGAGKSTTIRMILGLIEPDKGQVIIDGYNVASDRFKALKKVGALIEGPAFYEYLTAYENLKIFAQYSPGVSEDKIDDVLEIVGLIERSREKVKGYSMGMKQRLGIAQALLNDPCLIILDEPTNGLDPYGVKGIRNLINTLSLERDTTIFISSHILTEIEQISNKVAIISRGKLLSIGLVESLLNPDQSIYEITGPDLNSLLEIVKKNKDLTIMKIEPLRIKIEKGKSEDILSFLVSQGAKVSSFYPYQPTLEEFFFSMTGEGNDELHKNRMV